MTNRVGRVSAIAEELLIGLISGDQLILLKRKQEINKWALRNLKSPDGVLKGNQHGMTRLALIASHQFFFPPAQEAEGARPSTGFVGQIIGPAAIRVHIVKVL